MNSSEEEDDNLRTKDSDGAPLRDQRDSTGPQYVTACIVDIRYKGRPFGRVECRATTVIGRHRPAHLLLMSSSISRLQCALAPFGDQWMIIDLASRYGTFVNGRRVTSQILAVDDVVKIGKARIRVLRFEDRVLTPPERGRRVAPAIQLPAEETMEFDAADDRAFESARPLRAGRSSDVDDVPESESDLDEPLEHFEDLDELEDSDESIHLGGDLATDRPRRSRWVFVGAAVLAVLAAASIAWLFVPGGITDEPVQTLDRYARARKMLEAAQAKADRSPLPYLRGQFETARKQKRPEAAQLLELLTKLEKAKNTQEFKEHSATILTLLPTQ